MHQLKRLRQKLEIDQPAGANLERPLGRRDLVADGEHGEGRLEAAGARVTGVEADRFVMAYALFSHALEKVAAEGEGTIVCYDYRNSCKAPLPERIKRRIAQIESGR